MLCYIHQKPPLSSRLFIINIDIIYHQKFLKAIEQEVKSKSTILCHFKSWWKWNVLPPRVDCITHVLLESDSKGHADTLRCPTTAELLHLRAGGARLRQGVWYHPDLLFQPRPHVSNGPRVGGIGATPLLVLSASRSLIREHCRAAERHWKADQSHCSGTGRDAVVTCRGLGVVGIPLNPLVGEGGAVFPKKQEPGARAPRTSVCLSMCLHSV